MKKTECPPKEPERIFLNADQENQKRGESEGGNAQPSLRGKGRLGEGKGKMEGHETARVFHAELGGKHRTTRPWRKGRASQKKKKWDG